MLTENLHLFNSLSLEDRIEILNNNQIKTDFYIDKTFCENWKANFFRNEDKYHARIALLNIDEDKFKKAISFDPSLLPHDAMNILGNQQWYQVIKEVFSQLEDNSLSSSPKNFTASLYPFLIWAEKKWNEYFISLSEREKKLLNQKKLLQSLTGALAKELISFSLPSLVLEVNVARLLNEIEGETPEQRFESFVTKKLSSSSYLQKFYEEYSVLAKILSIRTIFIVNNTTEAMIRFFTDLEEVNQIISVNEDVLSEIEIGMGDKHQKGNSVMRFIFESKKEIMYKPKSLQVTERFHDLLHWFHSKGLKYDFKYHKIINKKNYAWEEVVEYISCDNVEEVKAFYYRYGALIGISHLLKGVDFHYENLIACGEYPVLIDLETLFHNTPNLTIPNTAAEKSKQAFADTVLGTNLLPVFLYQTENHKGIEFSGLGGEEQKIPFDVKQLVDVNTDKIRYSKKSAKLKPSNNRPRLKGDLVNLHDYTDDIINGFTDVLNLTLEHKKELVSEEGPVHSFANVPIRVIVRSTQRYTNLIGELNHPDFTRNFLDREKNLDMIWSYPIKNNNVINAEYQDLLVGDVPFFTSTPNSLNLVDSTGNVINNVFEKSSLELVIERIENFTYRDIRYQLNLLNGSLISILKESNKLKSKENTELFNTEDVTKKQLLHEAVKIGEYLKDTAIHGENDVTWLGLNLNHTGGWQITPLPVDFYEGVSGVSLFLGYLYKMTGHLQYKILSEKAIQTTLNYIQFLGKEQSMSSFYGISSLLYPLVQLQKIGITNSSIEQALESIIKHADLNFSRNTIQDFISGSSGVLVSLLSLYEKDHDDYILKICKKIANHILDNKITIGDSLAWSSIIEKDAKPLGGFAHGTSGISFALAKLGYITGESEFIDAAKQARKFEDSIFDQFNRNWFDMRKEEKTFSGYEWCNGNTGIGINRLFFTKYLESEDCASKKQLIYVIENLLNNSIYSNHSLCHGALGVADFFLVAGKLLKDENLLNESWKIVSNVLATKDKYGGFLSGAPQEIETPGLFLGLSGIGYQLLRFINPEEIPSLLSLEA